MNPMFTYQDNSLNYGDLDLSPYCSQIQTPCYLYSEKILHQSYQRFEAEARKNLGDRFLICYALKANIHAPLVRSLAALGSGADIVSGGELQAALDAGIKPEKIVFSGVGKIDEEMKAALSAGENGILSFNVESHEELIDLSRIATSIGITARFSLRLNPRVKALTHKHISTGYKTHKFGILEEDILKILRDLPPNTKFVGLSIHIGSQLTDLEATFTAVDRLLELSKKCPTRPEILDVGGGLGIAYEHQKNITPNLELYHQVIANKIKEAYGENHPLVVFEPGRSIVGPAGVFVTKVLRTKTSENCHFTIVDGGMNDFVRPSLYGAWHEIYLLKKNEGSPILTDIVGPICETADCFGSERKLPPLKKGDTIVIADAGAYGSSMSSCYNARPRVTEYFLDKNEKLTRGN